MKLAYPLFLFFGLFIVSCGPSAEEIKLRERIVKDSMNRILDSIRNVKPKHNNSRRSGNSGPSVKYAKRTSTDGKAGIIEFDKLKLEYQYDSHALNKSADIDCKLVNTSSHAFKDFVFRINCYDEYGDNIKSFEQTVDKKIKGKSDEKFTVSFNKVKKTKTVKVDLVRATQID